VDCATGRRQNAFSSTDLTAAVMSVWLVTSSCQRRLLEQVEPVVGAEAGAAGAAEAVLHLVGVEVEEEAVQAGLLMLMVMLARLVTLSTRLQRHKSGLASQTETQLTADK